MKRYDCDDEAARHHSGLSAGKKIAKFCKVSEEIIKLCGRSEALVSPASGLF
jgi:hypothetical protein